MGFPIESRDTFSALTAARQYMASKNLRPLLILEDDAMQDFTGLPTEDPNVVAVGYAPSKYNYEKINQAFRLIKDGAELVAFNRSRFMQTKDGLAMGTGMGDFFS